MISSVYAAYLRDIPITVHQPDGSVIECYATGDEYYNWLHDKDGYTIIQSQSDGYYYYDANKTLPNGYYSAQTVTDVSNYLTNSGTTEEYANWLLRTKNFAASVVASLVPGIL